MMDDLDRADLMLKSNYSQRLAQILEGRVHSGSQELGVSPSFISQIGHREESQSENLDESFIEEGKSFVKLTLDKGSLVNREKVQELVR